MAYVREDERLWLKSQQHLVMTQMGMGQQDAFVSGYKQELSVGICLNN